MLVNTKTAAEILGISTRRVCKLLQQGRIEGAYKLGRDWLIPLYGDRPLVRKANSGPPPTWESPRLPAKIIIKINRAAIKSNIDNEEVEPVISVKQGNNPAVYGHEVNIDGPCTICYSLTPRQEYGGPRVWIETFSKVEVFVKNFETNTSVAVG